MHESFFSIIFQIKSISEVGTLLTVMAECRNGHLKDWESQPRLGQMPIGNLLVASSAFLSGACITKNVDQHQCGNAVHAAILSVSASIYCARC